MAVTHTELSELSEQGLVESCHAGDHEAFDRIVRRFQPSLLAHARRRLGSQQAAEDAVQETLLRAYRALPRFNGEYRLGNWLHRILRNVCTDEANRNRRRLALVDRITATDPPCAHEAVEQTVFDRDRSSVVRALDELPESYRRAFVLRAVDELPYDEVAEACGITEENARARVSRARSVLRRTTARLGSFVAMVGFTMRRGGRAPSVTPATSASGASTASTASTNAPTLANASSTVSSVVSGPSPLAIQLTTAVHELAPAAGAASRAIAVLATAAAVVIPAAFTPDRDEDPRGNRAEVSTDATGDGGVELTLGDSPVEIPITELAPSTTVSAGPERPPQASATELTVAPDGAGWTVAGRLSIDTGTAVVEGTIEPYSRLTLGPEGEGDPAQPRPFEITAFVTLDDGQAITFRFTGSATLELPEAPEPEVPSTTVPPTTVPPATEPPADSPDTGPPTTESPWAQVTVTTLPAEPVVTTTTAPPVDPADDPDSGVQRFELSGQFVAEGSSPAGLGGGTFYGALVIGSDGGSLQLSLASPST